MSQLSNRGELTNSPLVLVDSTQDHFYKAPEVSIADISPWNKAWAEVKGSN